MAAFPEGAPCWADAMLPDLEAGKRFYGELLGWTFGEGSAEYGNYTQAFSDGKNVAALMPLNPEWQTPPSWSLYFASPDVEATAAKIGENGGEVTTGPTVVGDFGRMLVAQDPAGAVFGVWEPAEHKGFEKRYEPGAFCWAEVATRDTKAVDAFYPAVFPFTAKQVGGDGFDFVTWEIGGSEMPVAGRYPLPAETPAEIPAHVMIYFAVPDCDDAVATVTKLGGTVTRGPEDSPFGRFASVVDPQGAAFSVIDLGTTVGEM